MKLSFSLSSSSKPTFSSSSSSLDQPPQKELITEFDQSKPPTNSNPTSNNNPIIIPPIPNQWNHPQNQSHLQSKTIDPNITNGLNLGGSETLSSIDRLMLMKLKSDLKRLPDDKGLEEFNDVSVGEFGGGYLKGYGWYEGRGIGKNVKEDVKVFEFTKRSGNEGLGFVRIEDGGRKVVKSEKCGKNGGKRVAFCERE